MRATWYSAYSLFDSSSQGYRTWTAAEPQGPGSGCERRPRPRGGGGIEGTRCRHENRRGRVLRPRCQLFSGGSRRRTPFRLSTWMPIS